MSWVRIMFHGTDDFQIKVLRVLHFMLGIEDRIYSWEFRRNRSAYVDDHRNNRLLCFLCESQLSPTTDFLRKGLWYDRKDTATGFHIVFILQKRRTIAWAIHVLVVKLIDNKMKTLVLWNQKGVLRFYAVIKNANSSFENVKPKGKEIWPSLRKEKTNYLCKKLTNSYMRHFGFFSLKVKSNNRDVEDIDLTFYSLFAFLLKS